MKETEEDQGGLERVVWCAGWGAGSSALDWFSLGSSAESLRETPHKGPLRLSVSTSCAESKGTWPQSGYTFLPSSPRICTPLPDGERSRAASHPRQLGLGLTREGVSCQS